MCFQQPKITPQTLAPAPALAAAPPSPPTISTMADKLAGARNGRNSLRIDLAGPAGNTSLNGPTGLSL
jgi:hypothetical protein